MFGRPRDTTKTSCLQRPGHSEDFGDDVSKCVWSGGGFLKLFCLKRDSVGMCSSDRVCVFYSWEAKSCTKLGI